MAYLYAAVRVMTDTDRILNIQYLGTQFPNLLGDPCICCMHMDGNGKKPCPSLTWRETSCHSVQYAWNKYNNLFYFSMSSVSQMEGSFFLKKRMCEWHFQAVPYTRAFSRVLLQQTLLNQCAYNFASRHSKSLWIVGALIWHWGWDIRIPNLGDM